MKFYFEAILLNMFPNSLFYDNSMIIIFEWKWMDLNIHYFLFSLSWIQWNDVCVKYKTARY